MLARLLLWSLTRCLLGTGLLAAGLAIDGPAGFRRFAPQPGFAVLAAALGAVALLRAARALAAAGEGRLAESGPFQVMRHPMSAGFQLLLLGAALALGSPGGLLAGGPLAFLLWAGHARFLEEPALHRRFPRQYRRYARGTGFLIPSIYYWSLQLIYVFYRLWCGLQIRGLEQVPRSGPFFLIALHRSYLDPYIMTFHIGRKVHGIATAVLFRQWLVGLYFKSLGAIPLARGRADLRPIRAAFRLLDSGGAVGLYPEGARSWYGETACEPAVFRLLERPGVPIVTVELYGAFEQQPRFSRRLRRSRLGIRYRLHPPRDAQGLLRDLLARERGWDARRRALARPMPARSAEQLVYLCPQCRVPFRLRGHDDGRLVCSACGTGFVLLEGKGLSGPQGISSLVELEKSNLAWTQAYRPEGLRIAGRLVCRQTARIGGAGGRLPDPGSQRRGRCLRAGVLALEPEGLSVEEAQGPLRRIAYGEITSVLVESNCKLELSYRAAGRGGYLFFLPPLRYAVFLQHFLRLRAFANPYARYRGSGRVELP